MRDSDRARRGSEGNDAFQDRDETNGDPPDVYELADVLDADAFLGFLKVVGENRAPRREYSEEMIEAAAARASGRARDRVHRLNEIGIPIHILQRLKRPAPPRGVSTKARHEDMGTPIDTQRVLRPVFLDSHGEATLFADNTGALYVQEGEAGAPVLHCFGIPSASRFGGYLRFDRIGLGDIEEAFELVCARSAGQRRT
jgi:hypothetical protein